MKRRKSKPIKTKVSDISYKISKWCKLHYNDGTLFDVPMLCKQIGLNPDSRSDYNKVYSIILSWRNGFIDFYNKLKITGMLDGMNRYEAWDTMLDNYNKNDAYVFLSKYNKKEKVKYFIQPGFVELESLDKKRLEKQWKGIGTVIDEMLVFDARLILPDGSRKSVSELLKAGKKVDKLLPRNQVKSSK